MPSGCRTRLISDAPASADAFGAHQRIASALADIIREEQGGKAVGLEGGWGSGKSTVINLLRSQTQSDPNIVFVVFDAWAHEGDPLRRTFLETLIEAFVPLRWIDPPRWAEKREELARRKKVRETTTTPRLTLFAKYLLGSTFLVPIGFALLNAALRNPVFLLPGTGRVIAWQLLIGLFFTLAPLIVIAWARVHRASGDAWAILVKGMTTTERSEAVESPEPTSVEFQQVFMDLMKEALDASTDRRAVLVVDNLDRVATDDALSIWSSLRTFFLLGEHRQPEWFDRFWIIVPYDPRGIRRLWSQRDGTQIATSFLSKTFQLRLSVPPLLLANWRPYLISLLEQAFPDHDPADFHAVYRLYASMPSQDPNPRRLKLYVNDIGGIHRQWQDGMPLPDIAYYVLLRQGGRKVESELRGGRLPSAEFVGLVSLSVQDNLAALAFNTDVPEARQLLLREGITRALERADQAALEGLSSSAGFWEVMESIDFGQWSEHESSKLANAALCILEAGILTVSGSAMERNTMSSLQRAAAAVTRWHPLGEAMSRGLGALCRLGRSRELAERIVRSLTPSGEKEAEETPAAEWTETIVGLLKALADIDLLPGVGEVVIPGYAKTSILACHHLSVADPDGRFRALFRLSVERKTFEESIASFLSDQSLTPQLVGALRVMRSIDADWSLEAIAGKVRAPLEDTGAAPHVSALLDVLVDLRSDVKAAKQAIQSLATGGFLFHHLHAAVPGSKVQDGPTAARCLVLQLEAQPALSAPPAVGNAIAGQQIASTLVVKPPPELIAAVTSYLSERGQGEFLFEVIDKNPALKPFVLECLRSAVNSRLTSDFFPPGSVVRQWPLVSELEADGAEDTLAARLMTETRIVEYLETHEFEPDRGELYARLVRVGAGERLRQACQVGLRQIGVERWIKELLQERNLVELVVDLVEAGVEIELTHFYKDAILEHARGVANGDAEPSYLESGHWGKLFAPLNPDTRKVLQGDLLEVATASQNLPPAFFEFYGDELAQVHVLQAPRAIPGLFTSLVRTGNVSGLKWMIAFLKEANEFLATHPEKSAVRDFRRRVAERLQADSGEASEEVRSLRAELADTIGVDSRKNVSSDEG